MKYAEYLTKEKLTRAEILAISWGTLVEDEPIGGMGLLPAPPMLMFDRVLEVKREGSKGRIVAEQDVVLDAWFFQCHFRQDPVQPGCLGVDAVWQLLGLYCSLRGARGTGRALGCREIEFMGQIRPYNKVVTYDIEIRRYMENKTNGMVIVIGTGKVLVDGEHIYTINDAKVGMFEGIRYDDYPNQSKHSVGGVMKV